MRNDGISLSYISESLERVERYLAGADGVPNEKLFRENPGKQDAVLRRMETLADATTHVSDELMTRHPEVPWRTITGFRNVVAHDYTAIDLDLVWQAIVGLPALKAVVQQELGGIEPPPSDTNPPPSIE